MVKVKRKRLVLLLATSFLLTLLTFFVFKKISYAAFSMVLQDLSNPNVNSNEQEVILTASISGLPSESFFRIAFQESSGKPYFGYMKNNANDWVKIDTSQDCKNYYKVSDASTSALLLNAKIGDDNSVSNGNYTFKLRRYTASCASYSDSNAISVIINLPTPTPSPSPSSTPSPTPSQTPTPTPIKTPTPIPSVVKTSTPKLVPTISPTATPLVLSVSDSLTPTPTAIEKVQTKPKNNAKILGVIFTSLGIICVGISVYLIYKKSKISRF